MPRVTLAEFATLWTRAGQRAPRAERVALARSAARFARTARGYIGHYQNFSGPFHAWAPLSKNTLMGGVTPSGFRYKGKVELGYAPPDNPLLRTGEMRDSIQSTVIERAAVVFSLDPVAGWQEFGVRGSMEHYPIPPRPFIGPAVYMHAWEEVQYVARVVFAPILTGRL